MANSNDLKITTCIKFKYLLKYLFEDSNIELRLAEMNKGLSQRCY